VCPAVARIWDEVSNLAALNFIRWPILFCHLGVPPLLSLRHPAATQNAGKVAPPAFHLIIPKITD
jgi:hypothetical protein